MDPSSRLRALNETAPPKHRELEDVVAECMGTVPCECGSVVPIQLDAASRRLWHDERVRAVVPLLLIAGCAAPVEIGRVPLLLPVSVSAERAGTELRLVVFGLEPMAARPVVLGTQGVVETFEWLGSSGTKPGGVELIVTTSMPRGKIYLQLAGNDGGVVESNRVRLESAEVVFAEPPELPALVAWSQEPSSVLIVAQDFGSGVLVDTQGKQLPIGSLRCARAGSDMLREAAQECFITRQQPLSTGGFGGRSVRALVQTPSGPVLTPSVVLP